MQLFFPIQQKNFKMMVLGALTVSSGQEFQRWHEEWKETKNNGYDYLSKTSGKWTQFIIHVIDERGNAITDYHLQLYIERSYGNTHTQTEFEMDMYPYSRDKSYRCYHVDLGKLLNAASDKDIASHLCIRVIANSGSNFAARAMATISKLSSHRAVSY